MGLQLVNRRSSFHADPQIQPVNVTSTRLNGRPAGSYQGFDIAHPTVGFGANHVATIFRACSSRPGLPASVRWAPYRCCATHQSCRQSRRNELRRNAKAVHFGLGARAVQEGMVVAYVGLPVGLGTGALLTQSARHRAI